MELIYGKPKSLYAHYYYKLSPDKLRMHYCSGCGHGIFHRLIAEAMDDLGIREKAIMVNPVGCAVFAYMYFNCDNIQSPHGRAPAIATGVKRVRPDNVVMTYQGDGDLGAIGIAEIMHAANRGENITTFFVNNAIYGMTGGQMAPTTLEGQKSSTSPYGRDVSTMGHPMKISEIIAQIDGTAYVERVSLSNVHDIMKAEKAIRKALKMQLDGKGFSMVEALSMCPTQWKIDTLKSVDYVENEMKEKFPLGVIKDITADDKEGDR